MKKFLVVVDTQYDFMMPDGALYVQGAENIIVPGIRHLSNLDPEIYDGVLFTYDSHTPEYYEGSPESNLFPIHCEIGTPGWENVFHENMVPTEIPTYDIFKSVFDMWVDIDSNIHEQDEEDVDRDLFFDILSKDTIIEVIGVASDFCVKQAVDGFVKRGFKVEVIKDLTKGINLESDFVFDGIPYNNVKVI